MPYATGKTRTYLAVIVESAAVNHRQKMMGYNAAKELYRRVQENLMRGGEDDDE